MKLSELFETFEEVPEIDVRKMTPIDRVKHYRFVQNMHWTLMKKAREFFYNHSFHRAEQPEDHRMYEYKPDAQNVATKMTNGASDKFIIVLNITADIAARAKIERRLRRGQNTYDDRYRYIPITPENEEFRKKTAKLVEKYLNWEDNWQKAHAAAERNDLQYRKSKSIELGVNLSHGHKQFI